MRRLSARVAGRSGSSTRALLLRWDKEDDALYAAPGLMRHSTPGGNAQKAQSLKVDIGAEFAIHFAASSTRTG